MGALQTTNGRGANISEFRTSRHNEQNDVDLIFFSFYQADKKDFSIKEMINLSCRQKKRRALNFFIKCVHETIGHLSIIVGLGMKTTLTDQIDADQVCNENTNSKANLLRVQREHLRNNLLSTQIGNVYYWDLFVLSPTFRACGFVRVCSIT